MSPTRRHFLKSTLAAPLTAAALPASTAPATPVPNERYAQLDQLLRQPVLKRDLFATPILIESLELLRYKDSFLCRVRSKDGAEGISVGHSTLDALHPIFGINLKPFFL